MANSSVTSASSEFSSLMALAAFFERDFSIDLAVELMGKKASLILCHLEEGIRQGYLTKKDPGVFSFAAPDQRQRWHQRGRRF